MQRTGILSQERSSKRSPFCYFNQEENEYVIILKRNANPEKVEILKQELEHKDLTAPSFSRKSQTSLIGLIGDTTAIHEDWLKAMDVVRMCAGSGSPIKRPAGPCIRKIRLWMSAARRWAAGTSRSLPVHAPSRPESRSPRWPRM